MPLGTVAVVIATDEAKQFVSTASRRRGKGLIASCCRDHNIPDSLGGLQPSRHRSSQAIALVSVLWASPRRNDKRLASARQISETLVGLRLQSIVGWHAFLERMAMTKSLWIRGFTAALLVGFVVSLALAKGSKQGEVPAPSSNTALAAQPGEESAVFSGGCFWGVQAVFQHVKGVISATSGYSGGAASTAQYEEVSTGQTGHAESVKVVYDPSQVSYGQLLHVFFLMARHPTQLDRQGPDEGRASTGRWSSSPLRSSNG